jgi:hypothetical protein
VATAIINGDGNLQLIGWDVSDDGNIARDLELSKTIGAAQDLAAVSLGGITAKVITAIRNGQGNLQLNGWTMPASGKIDDARLALAGDVSKVAVAALDGGAVAVAMRTAEKMFRLHGYGVATDQFQEEPFATSDLKSEVEIEPALGVVSLGVSRVFTAAARGDFLNVDVWDIAPSCP